MSAVFYFPLIGTPTAEGNQLFFYVAGEDQPLDVWTDSDLTIPWAQPIVLNAAGESDGPIYVSSSPSYKVVYTDANDVPIPGYPVDFVSPSTILNVTTVATVQLTNAQIKALPTTPITLIAAPASGLMVRLLAATLRINATAGAYTNVNTTFASLQIQYPSTTWLALGPVNDSTLTAPLSRLTTFLGAVSRVATLLPYAEAIQSNAGGGDWGYLQPSVATTLTDVNGTAVQLAIDNNGSGALTGGNAANTLTCVLYYVLESVA